MGDIADAILDGELCQECGGYAGPARGYPFTCQDCRRDASREKRKNATPAKVACPICGKKVKAAGLGMHKDDVHGGEGGTP